MKHSPINNAPFFNNLTIYLLSVYPQSVVQIHGVDGVLVRTVQLQEGVNIVTGLAPGFYVVEGQKAVIYSK